MVGDFRLLHHVEMDIDLGTTSIWFADRSIRVSDVRVSVCPRVETRSVRPMPVHQRLARRER